MSSKLVYFTSLELENVRAFGERQELSLTTNGNSSVPARWTLIIGENGVGKTTLLQCLANMRPVPTERLEDKSENAEKKKCINPAISDELNNETFDALAKAGSDVHLVLKTTLSLGVSLNGVKKKQSDPIFTSLTVERKGGKLDTVEPDGTFIEDFQEPLVIGYGASRHMGYANSGKIVFTASVASLFDSSLELFDAEEILQQLDYSQLKKEHCQVQDGVCHTCKARGKGCPNPDGEGPAQGVDRHSCLRRLQLHHRSHRPRQGQGNRSKALLQGVR